MKRLLGIFAVGVGLGIFLSVIQIYLKIDRIKFMHGYWIAGTAAVLFIVLVYMLYAGAYQKKISKAIGLLEEGKAEEYIKTIEAMLCRTKGRNIRNVLWLNLSAGYCDLGQYDQALHILEGIPQKELRGMTRTVCHLNLCFCYFHTSRISRALALYHECQKEFEPLRKREDSGGGMAVLDMLAAVAGGEYDLAEKMLENARKTWVSLRLEDDYQYIEGLIKEEAESRQEDKSFVQGRKE